MFLSPSREGKTSSYLIELDESTAKLYQVLLLAAHCYNSDNSNFLQGNEIFQTI